MYAPITYFGTFPVCYYGSTKGGGLKYYELKELIIDCILNQTDDL